MIGFAEYSVRQVDHSKHIVWIIDHGAGTTVTNAADSVVVELHLRYPGYRIIYRDTAGYWDELLHEGGRFTGFAPARDMGLP